MNICIIGNNLSSLTLSNALLNKNIKFTIFYSEKKKLFYPNRTIGITQENIEFFNKEILKVNSKYLKSIKQIEIFTEKNKKKILNFEERKNNLFKIIEYEKLYTLLDKNLSKKKIPRQKIKSSKFYEKILINKKYDLIINCEKNNILNKKLFYKKFKKDYFSDAYTSTILHKKINNNKAVQIFTRYGPLAYLPISNTKTSIVFSVYKKNKIFCEKELSSLIKTYNKFYLIKKISNFEKASLKYFFSLNYYKKNVLLFGDSLHQVHPLAGQGFNMTLRDLRILLEEIQNKVDLGLILDASVLKTFEEKTKHLNLFYSNGINLIQDFFRIDSKFKKTFSNDLITFLGKNKMINTFIKNVANKGISI
tara:strand:+ start:1476 stop:2567 length:1092 start_codon:yes stop_codon:yes gene_type:complete